MRVQRLIPSAVVAACVLAMSSVNFSASAADNATGLTYWIELDHAGQISHVTQKATFASGDRIKFHVKPNIDGYAYVVLKSGSQGERSVLFPLAGSKDDNHVAKGVDIAIPSDDFMEFDAHPGIEKLSLTLSPTPVDSKALLLDAPETEKVVMKAQPGSKDLVPMKIKVVYTAPDATKIAESSKSDKKYAPAGIAYNPNAGGTTHSNKETLPTEFVGGEVTVTKSDPQGVLNVDVDLCHSG